MIIIENISKSYGRHKVIDDISLSINSGSVFGFLGPNGSGKTTTMKMLVGLTRSDTGSIEINGRKPQEIQTRENIGFMPEESSFYDRLTGLEFLKFSDQLFAKQNVIVEKQYDELLRQVGIYQARNRIIRTYSKGMKQRLGFAQAVVNDPGYIFLDEPLEGLDPIGRREMKEVIRQMRQKQKTIFFNSHILTDIEDLCDSIGIICAGRILYKGSVEEFCKGKPLEEKFISTVEEYNQQHHDNEKIYN